MDRDLAQKLADLEALSRTFNPDRVLRSWVAFSDSVDRSLALFPETQRGPA